MNKFLILYRCPGDKITHTMTVLGNDADDAVANLEEMEEVECVEKIMALTTVKAS